jgi:acetolactate synthase-1/2/3 large subunit
VTTAAIGTGGAPATPVDAIDGDGGFNMMLGELETAWRAGVGLTIVVVNNPSARPHVPAIITVS